jgi:cell division protease FtsH
MNMKNNARNIAIWVAVFIGIATIFNSIVPSGNEYKDINFSEFLSLVEEAKVSKVKIHGKYINGQTIDGNSFNIYYSDYPKLVEKLHENNVIIEMKPIDTRFGYIVSILIYWLPMVFLVVMWLFFLKQMGGGGSKGFGFAKSKAKLMSDKGPKIKFTDVAGIEEAKEELSEIVDFLRDPSKFQSIGGRIPRGCLLVGPPGTGKTLLAKAISGEANVPFFSISGSDFVEMFVGVGASRVRDMFAQGKRNAPCIIFIDEIDAVGRHRGAGVGGGNDEREQTLNQILVEMDGFESNEGVIIIAATNRPDVLDPALLRPGRFDRQITLNNPDILGREKILQVHLKKVRYSTDIDPRIIARGTPGFSGAELANLVNEGALIAARKNKTKVDMADLEYAKDKVLMGVERRSMVMSDEEKKITAYHESGHAIVGLNVRSQDPIHKATIIPRGRALGLVMRLPESDRVSLKREKMESDIAVAMGGRVAEEIIFGHDKVTSGASSDIKMATRFARAMVTEWGMSESLGYVSYKEDQAQYGGQRSFSDATATLIDEEVKKIVKEGYDYARKILEDKVSDLHKLAKALIQNETMSGKQITRLLEGEEDYMQV